MCEQLITHIEENLNIKESLFPSPGGNASTQNGGGKTKTESHLALAVLMFKHCKKYGKAFSRISGKKDEGLWAAKIKNKLVS